MPSTTAAEPPSPTQAFIAQSEADGTYFAHPTTVAQVNADAITQYAIAAHPTFLSDPGYHAATDLAVAVSNNAISFLNDVGDANAGVALTLFNTDLANGAPQSAINTDVGLAGINLPADSFSPDVIGLEFGALALVKEGGSPGSYAAGLKFGEQVGSIQGSSNPAIEAQIVENIGFEVNSMFGLPSAQGFCAAQAGCPQPGRRFSLAAGSSDRGI